MDMHTTLRRRVRPFDVIRDGGGTRFGGLLEGDSPPYGGITTQDGDYCAAEGQSSLDGNGRMSRISVG